MTLEELQAEVARLSGELTAVTANNKKLVGELRAAKKGAEVDPAEFERLENELSTVQGQLADANKALKTANATAEKATKELDAERGYTSSLLVDGGLTSALTEAGVKNPAHLKAAAALLKTTAKVEVTTGEGGARTAMVDGKPLADFVKGWAAGDDGKAFVAAPGNSGGGAAGGGTGGAPKGNPNGTPTERAQYYADKFGLPAN
jgi:hypothetical protein